MLPFLFKLTKMKRCQALLGNTASHHCRGLVQESTSSPVPPFSALLPRQSTRKLPAKCRNCTVHPRAPPRPADPHAPAQGARPSPASIASFSIPTRSKQTCSGSSARSWWLFIETWQTACMSSVRRWLTSPARLARCARPCQKSVMGSRLSIGHRILVSCRGLFCKQLAQNSPLSPVQSLTKTLQNRLLLHGLPGHERENTIFSLLHIKLRRVPLPELLHAHMASPCVSVLSGEGQQPPQPTIPLLANRAV